MKRRLTTVIAASEVKKPRPASTKAGAGGRVVDFSASEWKGRKVGCGVVDTPFGQAFAAVADGRGGAEEKVLCYLSFGDDPALGAGEEEGKSALAKKWPGAVVVSEPSAAAEAVRRAFEDGSPQLCLTGTEFQIAVWKQLLRIPKGQTWSYKDVAESVGRPSAVRAVASAVASNDVSYFVPCHRVVHASTSRAPRYRWGPELKTQMLASEKGEAPGPHGTAPP